jgi:hypothetical protein
MRGGPGAEAARHVSGLLMRLAESNAATRSNTEAAVVPSLVYDLDRHRDSFDPHPVTHRRLYRSWRPRACRHHGATPHRVAATYRCAVDADTVAARPVLSHSRSAR